MRKSRGALTILAALAMGLVARPVVAGGPGCATCGHAAAAANLLGHGHGNDLPLWDDESPLYANLAWWTMEHSQCKQPHPWKGGTFHDRKGIGEVPSFPPLPYSPLAGRVYPQGMSTTVPPGVTPAPAAVPAPADAAATTPPPVAPAESASPAAAPRNSRPPLRRPGASPFEPTGGAPPPPSGFSVD